jgi:uncharacterized protein (UPF0332 family)
MPSSEIVLYLKRAHDDLRAAESNLQQGFHGVAVTRAYYAMFYAASALLAHRGIHRSRHSGVVSAFGEQFVKTDLIEPEYAKILTNAFDSRLDADYDLTFVVEEGLAKDSLDQARLFVDRVEQYLNTVGAT